MYKSKGIYLKLEWKVMVVYTKKDIIVLVFLHNQYIFRKWGILKR